MLVNVMWLVVCVLVLRRYVFVKFAARTLKGTSVPRVYAYFAFLLSNLICVAGKNVSVILTTSTESPCQSFLDELNSREQKPKVMHLPPLRRDEILSFLKPNLPNGVVEEPALADLVLAKKDAGNPLWLSLLCLELSNSASW